MLTLKLALPLLLSGTFSFTNLIEPAGRLTIDVIDMRMPDAEERLSKLRAMGANCELKMSNTFRCSKFHGADAVAESSLDELEQIHLGDFVTFGNQTGTPELISDGTAIREWIISQKIAVPEGEFETYRLREYTDGSMRKVILPDGQEFIIDGDDRLTRYSEVRVNESRWRFHHDVAFVVLNREKKSEFKKGF